MDEKRNCVISDLKQITKHPIFKTHGTLEYIVCNNSYVSILVSRDGQISEFGKVECGDFNIPITQNIFRQCKEAPSYVYDMKHQDNVKVCEICGKKNCIKKPVNAFIVVG